MLVLYNKNVVQNNTISLSTKQIYNIKNISILQSYVHKLVQFLSGQLIYEARHTSNRLATECIR